MKPDLNQRLGLRAYARHRGVTLSAVQKAIATGRIRRRRDGLVDVAEADRRWQQQTRPPTDRISSARAAVRRATVLLDPDVHAEALELLGEAENLLAAQAAGENLERK